MSDGFGTFRLGSSDGQVTTEQGTYPVQGNPVRDNTVGYVQVKTRSLQTVTRTARSRGYLWVTSQSAAYSYDRSAYSPWTSARVLLQYRMPGPPVWRYAKHAYANRYGRTVINAYAATTRCWPAVSGMPWRG